MSEPPSPSLRPLEAGECPCAACGVAVSLPAPGTDEGGRRLPLTPNRRTVIVVSLASRHVDFGRKLVLSRCVPCLARYDAWAAWPGLPEYASERLACAAELLGFVGTPGRGVLDAADLSPGSLRDPRTSVLFVDGVREERPGYVGSVAVAPWSHLDAAARGALRAVRAEAFAAVMNPSAPPPVPCPPALRADIAHRASTLEAVDGGCLLCGIEAIPAGKEWTHKTVPPSAFLRRGGPNMVVGHVCHVCSRAVASHGFGIAAIDEALQALGMKIPLGYSTDGAVKTFAGIILRDRLAGRTGPRTGYVLAFNWIRDADGQLPQTVLSSSPPVDYSSALNFNPKAALEAARRAAQPPAAPLPQQVIHTREVVTKVVREPITVDDARGVLLADTLARNAAAKRAADKAAVAQLATRSGRKPSGRR